MGGRKEEEEEKVVVVEEDEEEEEEDRFVDRNEQEEHMASVQHDATEYARQLNAEIKVKRRRGERMGSGRSYNS